MYPRQQEKGKARALYFVCCKKEAVSCNAKYVPMVAQTAKEHDIPFQSIRIESKEEARNAPTPKTDDILRTAYKEMLQGYIEHPDHGEWYAMWMICRNDDTHVGDLSFKGLNADGSVEIGYGILEEYRGCGYATEAVTAAVNWALAQHDVTRVEAEVESDNIASKRVLEKCGFIPSGVVGEEGPIYVRLHQE